MPNANVSINWQIPYPKVLFKWCEIQVFTSTLWTQYVYDSPLSLLLLFMRISFFLIYHLLKLHGIIDNKS